MHIFTVQRLRNTLVSSGSFQRQFEFCLFCVILNTHLFPGIYILILLELFGCNKALSYLFLFCSETLTYDTRIFFLYLKYMCNLLYIGV